MSLVRQSNPFPGLFVCAVIIAFLWLMWMIFQQDASSAQPKTVQTINPAMVFVTNNHWFPGTNTMEPPPLPMVVIMTFPVTNGMVQWASALAGPWLDLGPLNPDGVEVQPVEMNGTKFWRLRLNGTNYGATFQIDRP